jgi:PAS domain S-box-containing protein
VQMPSVINHCSGFAQPFRNFAVDIKVPDILTNLRRAAFGGALSVLHLSSGSPAVSQVALAENVAQKTQIKIGVQSTEGTTRTIEAWRPLIAALNDAAIDLEEDFSFVAQPMSRAEIRDQASNQKLDLIFSDAASFVWSEVKIRARPLLSSAVSWQDAAVENVGSTVFSRFDRTDLTGIHDLSGQRVMAVDAQSLGGWLLAKREFLVRKLDPSTFLSSLQFSNGNEREVVYAVSNGLVDAGVVRSGVLESLAAENAINLRDFRTISSQNQNTYPFQTSTALFPGWSLSARPGVPEDVLAVVVETLLSVGNQADQLDHKPHIIWMAPQNSQSVHKLLIFLRDAPYENYLKQAVVRIYRTHRLAILIGISIMFLSVLFLIYELRRNLRLVEAGKNVLVSESRSKQFYRKAVEEHTVFCMLNSDGVISHVNEQFCATVSALKADLMNKDLRGIVADNQREDLSKFIAETAATGNPWTGPLRLKRSDGTIAFAECTIIPVQNVGGELSELALVASDVTKTYRGVSSESFHDSLELISDRVVVLKPNTLEILHLNQSALDYYQEESGKDKWKGKSLSEFVPIEEFEALELRGEILASGPDCRMTWEIGASGEVPYEVTLEYVDSENEDPRLVAIYRNISERRAAEMAKDEFISTISHELRTPLTSVKGALGLVLSGNVGDASEQVTKLVKMANTNCDRLVMLIDDILDLEKIEIGKMDYAMEKLDMADLVRSAVESNQFYADKYAVKIRIDYKDGEAGYLVNADKNRLTQVMDNLLSNASKFSDKGSEVVVSLQITQDGVALSVKDTGSGIPLAAQDTIFDKFTQADSSDTRSKAGTGLGLAIVKLIVQDHVGDISFVSKEGEGADFTVLLPHLTDAAASGSKSQAAAATSANEADRRLESVQKYISAAKQLKLTVEPKRAPVNVEQAIAGTGRIGNDNVLNWMTNRSRNMLSTLDAAQNIGGAPVFAISQNLTADQADQGTLIEIGMNVLDNWLQDTKDGEKPSLSIVIVGETSGTKGLSNKYTHVKSLDQAMSLLEVGSVDIMVEFVVKRASSKMAIIPVSEKTMTQLPVILAQARIAEVGSATGVVAKFETSNSSARGLARRA